MSEHDQKRFYHCDCLENGAEHDDRFYHCDCIEDDSWRKPDEPKPLHTRWPLEVREEVRESLLSDAETYMKLSRRDD